jgi:tripartite-type tricarboxylate transporter receptor subunit TctC
VEYGVPAPASTPRAIVNKLQEEIVKIIRKPEVVARFLELGADPVGNTPAEFAQQIETDIVMWAKVGKESGVRAD